MWLDYFELALSATFATCDNFTIKSTMPVCANAFLPRLARALTYYRQAMPFGNSKKYLEHLSSSILSQFKKYHSSGNLKLNNLHNIQSWKLCILTEKILPISLELNFTPNTLSCYGLNSPRTHDLKFKSSCTLFSALQQQNRFVALCLSPQFIHPVMNGRK